MLRADDAEGIAVPIIGDTVLGRGCSADRSPAGRADGSSDQGRACAIPGGSANHGTGCCTKTTTDDGPFGCSIDTRRPSLRLQQAILAFS